MDCRKALTSDISDYEDAVSFKKTVDYTSSDSDEFDELVKEEPWLKAYLVPKCEKLGYCDEAKCCGRKKTKEELGL